MLPDGRRGRTTRGQRIKMADSLEELTVWRFSLTNNNTHAGDDYKKFLKGKNHETNSASNKAD